MNKLIKQQKTKEEIEKATKDLELVEQEWKTSWNIPSPLQTSGKTDQSLSSLEEEEQEEEEDVVVAAPVRLLLHDDVKANHYYIWKVGKIDNCPIPLVDVEDLLECTFTTEKKELTIPNPKLDAVLFGGDEPFFSGKVRQIPPKPKALVRPFPLYGQIFREALPKMKPKHWKGVDDFRVTYNEEDDVLYPYWPNVHNLVSDARQAKKMVPKLTEGPPTAFVSLRCGRNGDDGRMKRTEFAQGLIDVGALTSYGHCLNNQPWPEGHKKDKMYVMKIHKFCLAFENTDTPWYHTEKLFDCFRAASVPVYFGHRATLEKIIPGLDSVILIEDFDMDPVRVAAYLAEIAADETKYESYRAWIDDPPKLWLDFLEKHAPNTVACRVCQHVYLQKRLLLGEGRQPEDDKGTSKPSNQAQTTDLKAPSIDWRPRDLYLSDKNNMAWEVAQEWLA